jgi:hypothetical protein
MKTRRVVISLIFVVAFMMAACGEAEPPDERRQENRNAAPTIDPTAKAGIKQELDQAASLLTQAKSELDKDPKEAEAQAKRFLGYPSFVIVDFRDPRALAARLQTNRPLSKYLFSNFAPANKNLLEKEQDDAQALANVLRQEFDQQLSNEELYLDSRFPKENLTPETEAELQRNQSRINSLSSQELANLNRRLLQDSYKEFIKPADSENVLRHLDQAQKLTQALGPSDVQRKTLSNMDEALKASRALLNKPSEDREHNVLSTSDLDKVSGYVAEALTSLNASGKSAPSFTDSLMEIVWEVLYYLLLILAVVVPLALIAFFIKRARDNAAAKELANLQAFKKIIDRHDHLQQEFISFKTKNTSEIETLKDQISRLESAYRILARKNEQYANSSSANFQNADRYYEPPPPPVREEPEFPVSAETYLQKMKGSNRSTTVIRPDFQNGILVKDGEGRGELVLIEDLTRPVDFQRLFVVPSVSQFQMKQDFYNYYEGYYECDQPTAGDVWILHPAIVEKVNGGWRLREKGRLEVRS